MYNHLSNNIAVCIINNNSFDFTRMCVNNLLAKTKLSVNLYIYDMDEYSNIEKMEFIDYLSGSNWSEIDEEPKHKYFNAHGKTLTEIKSMFMVVSKEKYLCYVPISCLVGNNWLEDLIYNYTECQNAGIVSIKNQTTKCKLSVLPFNDLENELVLNNVWLGEGNCVEGLMFFDRDMVNNLYPLMFGVEQNIQTHSDYEMSLVSNLKGKNNFYILKQTLLNLQIPNQVLFPKFTHDGACEFRKYANELAKAINKNE
jgi:hypothetical protein